MRQRERLRGRRPGPSTTTAAGAPDLAQVPLPPQWRGLACWWWAAKAITAPRRRCTVVKPRTFWKARPTAASFSRPIFGALPPSSRFPCARPIGPRAVGARARRAGAGAAIDALRPKHRSPPLAPPLTQPWGGPQEQSILMAAERSAPPLDCVTGKPVDMEKVLKHWWHGHEHDPAAMRDYAARGIVSAADHFEEVGRPRLAGVCGLARGDG